MSNFAKAERVFRMLSSTCLIKLTAYDLLWYLFCWFRIKSFSMIRSFRVCWDSLSCRPRLQYRIACFCSRSHCRDVSDCAITFDSVFIALSVVPVDSFTSWSRQALELEDEVHKAAVTQAVTASLDEQVLNPMRKWLTEQVWETFRIETFDSNYFKQR